MNFSKKKITEDCHELRIWLTGRNAVQAKRRFATNKLLEQFKTDCLQLESYGEEYLKRFLNRESPYDELIREAKNPEAKREGALNVFGGEVKYWKEHAYPTFAPGWRANLDGYMRQFIAPEIPVVHKDTHFRSKLLVDLTNVKVMDITPAVLDALVVKLREIGNSQKTINEKIGWIQSVLNFSIERKRISSHPVVNYKKTEPPEPDVEFWEQDEAQSFLDWAAEKYPRGSEYRWVYAAYATAINLVPRAGEQWALRKSSMKRSLGVMRLSHQYDAKSHEFRELKGKEARNAPMNEMIYEELNYLCEIQKLGSNSLIFRNSVGGPINHDSFVNEFFEKDLLSWGGRRIKWHALRHTGATLMLQAGVDIVTLQGILGHKNIETTMRYVHALGGAIRAAGTKFSLGAKSVETTPPTPTPTKSEVSSGSEKRKGHLSIVRHASA